MTQNFVLNPLHKPENFSACDEVGDGLFTANSPISYTYRQWDRINVWESE